MVNLIITIVMVLSGTIGNAESASIETKETVLTDPVIKMPQETDLNEII